MEAPITLPETDLRSYRDQHPLARVFPLLDDIVGQAARETGSLMAVSDAAGQLLWVCGSASTLRNAETIGFVEGSSWDERIAGTNAPGLALRLDRPVSVVGAEHFRLSVQPWSCVATPIRDPRSGTVLGVLDVTGGDQILVPAVHGMVRATARLAETELARDLSDPGAGQEARSGTRVVLQALGRTEAGVRLEEGGSSGRELRLSPRHSEIVLLLAAAPQGLSGDELAVLLYDEDGASSTLRAELNRLRGLLGEELLRSRPYRLAGSVTGDWLAVEAHLAAGDLYAAMQGYAGPLLPRSTAPGVTRLRRALEGTLKEAVLRSGAADLMAQWTRSAWGEDDYDMWVAQRAALAADSPMRAVVDGQISRLDLELG